MAVGTNVSMKQKSHQPLNTASAQNRSWVISRSQTSWLPWVRHWRHAVVGSHRWGPELLGHTLELLVLTCALYTLLAPTHTVVFGSFL